MEYSTTVRPAFLSEKRRPNLRDGDKEKPGYRYGWRLFTQVATTMGVKLREQDVERWRTMFGITRALDDLVDKDGHRSIDPALQRLLAGEPVRQVTKEEASDFRASMLSRPADEQLRVVEEIKRIAGFANTKAQAVSLSELVECVNTEVGWYASLFELEEDGIGDNDKRRQFNEWLQSFMRSGYMIDSLLDMEEDFNSGNIAVTPSLRHKKALAGAALKEIAVSIRKTPVRRLGSLAYVAYRNIRPPETS